MMAPTGVAPKCDGCGRRFPYRLELSGRCPRCLKLQQYTKDSLDYKDITTWKQCEGCGDVNEHATASHCDDCKDRMITTDSQLASTPLSTQSPTNSTLQAIYSPAQERQEVSFGEEMLKQRAVATHARMSRQSRHPQPFGLNMHGNASPLASSLASPQPVSGVVQSSLMKIWVFAEVVQAKSKKTPFAKMADTFSGDTTIPTIIEHILKMYINSKWTTTHTHNLEVPDLEVTWAKAMTLEDGTASLALNAFYNHYNSRSWTSTYRSSAWKDHQAVKQGQKFVQLEITINESLFKTRTEAENANIGTTTRTKRKRSNTVARETLQLSIRDANTVNYALPLSVSEPKTLQYVPFNKLICELGDDLSSPKNHRFFQEATKLYGRVSTSPFAKGAIKVAHELIIEGQKHVAKRVFATDRSGNAPTRTENRMELALEHTRLLLLNWALDQFLTTARRHGIKIATNLDISATDSFLIETDLEIDGKTFFIVEPFRTPSTRKFSSSLTHGTQGNSKIDMTVAAFAHFIFAKWNRTLVYADIQGSPSPVGGRDGYVLFDPVFHSKEEMYGVADLGPEGIESFTNTHVCNEFCVRFSQVSRSMGNSMVFFPDNPEFEPPRKKARLSMGASRALSAEPQESSRLQSDHGHEETRPEGSRDSVDDGEEVQSQDEGLGEAPLTEKEGSDAKDDTETEGLD